MPWIPATTVEPAGGAHVKVRSAVSLPGILFEQWEGGSVLAPPPSSVPFFPLTTKRYKIMQVTLIWVYASRQKGGLAPSHFPEPFPRSKESLVLADLGVLIAGSPSSGLSWSHEVKKEVKIGMVVLHSNILS